MPAIGLKPLAEVEGALLVVEVLRLPHPKLLGLLGGVREHVCAAGRAGRRVYGARKEDRGCSGRTASTRSARAHGRRARSDVARAR
jgi:hypothetical protein